MSTLEIKVTGRVHGVGFRNFVYTQAVAERITGEVWNGKDGAVYVIAQHKDPKKLSELAESLKSGPGYVAAVSQQEGKADPYERFRITRDR